LDFSTGRVRESVTPSHEKIGLFEGAVRESVRPSREKSGLLEGAVSESVRPSHEKVGILPQVGFAPMHLNCRVRRNAYIKRVLMLLCHFLILDNFKNYSAQL
jgi:hypothetical protein